MKTVPWHFFVIVAIASSRLLAADRPTADELLTSYQKTVEKMARFRIETTEKVWVKGRLEERFKDNKDGFVGTTERTIYYDESRRRVSAVHQHTWSLRGVKEEHKDGGDYVVGEYLNKRQALQTQWSASPPDFAKLAMLDVRLRDELEVPSGFLGTAAIVIGLHLVDGNLPLWKVMRDASSLELSQDMETVGGVPTYVVKSRGRFGQHILWLDPQAGTLPRRIEIHKQPGDFAGDVQLGVEMAPPTLRRGGRLPPGFPKKRTLDEAHYRWDRIQVEEKSGLFVITAFDSTGASSKRIDDERENEEDRYELRATTVDFDPASWPAGAFLPGVDIPDGTTVRTNDPTMSAVWIGGHVQTSK